MKADITPDKTQLEPNLYNYMTADTSSNTVINKIKTKLTDLHSKINFSRHSNL